MALEYLRNYFPEFHIHLLPHFLWGDHALFWTFLALPLFSFSVFLPVVFPRLVVWSSLTTGSWHRDYSFAAETVTAENASHEVPHWLFLDPT